MKNITPTLPASPASTMQNRESSTSPMPTSPLASEILLELGGIYARQEVAVMLGDMDEARCGLGIQTGLVMALKHILPPDQFRQVMVQWEVDAIKLSEYLALAGGSDHE